MATQIIFSTCGTANTVEAADAVEAAAVVTDMYAYHAYPWTPFTKEDFSTFQLIENQTSATDTTGNSDMRVTSKYGKINVEYRPYNLVRGSPTGIYLPRFDYNKILPYILSYLDMTFWNPASHYNLSYFIVYTEDDYCNPINKCHQIVLATLLCNMDFNVKLPMCELIKIFSYFPQKEFRHGAYILPDYFEN